MRFNKFFRQRGLAINLLASFCFLMLAVYGWGMTWEKLGGYLLVLLILLAGLIAVAALFGWLLNKLRQSNRADAASVDKVSSEDETTKTDNVTVKEDRQENEQK